MPIDIMTHMHICVINHAARFCSAVIFVAVLVAAMAMPRGAEAQSAERNTSARFARQGFERMSARDYQAAARAFEEAVRYDDANAQAHLGMGAAFFHLHEDNAAERSLLRAIELNPGEARAYQVLGEISYRRDDPEAALVWWRKAAKLDPSSVEIRSRLERIEREHRTEQDFNRDVTGHFLVKYEGRERIETGKIILRILEDAYGEVGRSLSSYPSMDIQVILYSSEQFREVTEAPGWSGAVFDGKIRIPIGGIEQETPGLRRLLYHEYTHALVRSITPRVPTWLNEGLAQFFEGRDISPDHEDLLKGLVLAGSLPSLMQLEGSFMRMGGRQAAFAYLFSLSAVRFMEDRYGMHRIRTILDELAAGAGTADAIGRAVLNSYEDLDREWKRSLQ